MMKAALLTLTAGAALLVGGQADEAALKKEKARLEGTWNITSFATPKGELKLPETATVTFGKDGTLEFRKGDTTKKASFKLNPTAKPKEIDMSLADDATKRTLGIYQFEKNTLRLCFDLNGMERPTDFAAPEGGNRMLIILEKKK